MLNNPTTTIEEFDNWFMGEPEGLDFDYEEEFWEDQGLTFQAQNLPTWEGFSNAYPNEKSEELYSVVGGEVYQAKLDYPALTQNGCALKVSRALNYSGVTIPKITTTKGAPGTLKGKDGKYYFLNAKALNTWMRKTFGVNPQNTNHVPFDENNIGSNGENVINQINNQQLKGIFSMIAKDPTTFGASGHADILLSNGMCKDGCYLNSAKTIDIWILN